MPRSLFWRTLQVAGNDIGNVHGGWWYVWLVVWMLIAFCISPDGRMSAVSWTALAIGIAPTGLLVMACLSMVPFALRSWWSRCRARALGAE